MKRNLYRCGVKGCDYSTRYWVRIERHMDSEHAGGRIINTVEDDGR